MSKFTNATEQQRNRFLFGQIAVKKKAVLEK